MPQMCCKNHVDTFLRKIKTIQSSDKCANKKVANELAAQSMQIYRGNYNPELNNKCI